MANCKCPAPADKTGSVLLGGIDTSKFNGTLTRLPTHPLQLGATKDGALGIELTSVTASSPSGQDVLPFGTTPLLVELRLGTNLITLPDDLVEGIWTETGAKAVADTPGTAQIPCQMGNSPGLFSFKFATSPRINVSMSSLVLPNDLEPASATATLFNASEDVLCQFAIVKGGATFGLGEAFLRSACKCAPTGTHTYTARLARSHGPIEAIPSRPLSFCVLTDLAVRPDAVFDQDNTEIGIAQSNPEPTSSYVIQFPSSGAFIPLATPAADTTTPYPTAVTSASATPLATFLAATGFQTVAKAAKPAPAGVSTAAVAAGVVVGLFAILFGLVAWRIGVAKKPVPLLRHIPVLRQHVPRAWYDRDATELETKGPQPAAAEAAGQPWALGRPAGWNELESRTRPTELEGDSAFRPSDRKRGPRRPGLRAPPEAAVKKRDRPVCAARDGSVEGYTPPESPVAGTLPPTCTSTPSRGNSVASVPGRALTFLSTSSTASEEPPAGDVAAAPPAKPQTTQQQTTVEYLGPPLRATTSSPRDARTNMLVQSRSVFPCPATPSPVSPTPPAGSSWKLVTSAVELPPPTPSPPSRASSPLPSSSNVSPETTEPRSPGRQWV